VTREKAKVNNMDTTTINELPVLTWNWLKINNASFSFSGSPGRSACSLSPLPEGVTYREDAGTETAKYASVQTGVGKNIDTLLASSKTALITAKQGVRAAAPVLVSFDLADGSSSVCTQIIRAEKDSSVTVIISYTSPEKASGFHTIRTICSAAENAHIHLVKVQLLGSGFVQIDDTGTECGEGANVEVTQVILGGKETYAGVYASLPEYGASFKSDTAYLCLGSQKLDLNYVARHTGRKTDCRMQVKGTLRDNAQKTYRGSIDFRNGCSGSTGNEQEETLLLSPDVVNKSIPLILCDEEDVAGEHGASIGRLGEDVLFYMQSRGISKAAAEEIMAKAKVASVASLIPDETIVSKINSCIDEAFAHD
jgi:Fe-S cluster assembly protein SufD